MGAEGNIDTFLELLDWDGQTTVIAGESLDAQFKKAGGKPMELLHFALESQRDLSSDAVGGDEDKETFTFSITKEVDCATPQLFLAYCQCATDQDNPLALAKVSLRKAGTNPVIYLIYQFTAVAIKSWKLNCKDGGELPEEEIEFTFQQLLMTYTPQTSKGVEGRDRSMGWNFAAHEPL